MFKQFLNWQSHSYTLIDTGIEKARQMQRKEEKVKAKTGDEVIASVSTFNLRIVEI